jgi:cytoskeletal protein CcmA (bactofilin family)
MEMALFKKQPAIGLGQNATPEWHLPEGSTVSGQLNLEGSTRIDGHFDGDITANDSVIIGESGMITGDVKAVSIIVAGTVKGT